MKLRFIFEKETPGTVRFKEDTNDPADMPSSAQKCAVEPSAAFLNAPGRAAIEPAIGTLYVRKPALKSLGYKQGDAITVTLSKEDE